MEEIYFPKYFNDWLNRLNNEQREKFWFLNDVAIIKSQTRMEDLMERFNLRRSFLPIEDKTFKDIAKTELVKASEELTHTDLSPNWPKIHAELLYIQDKIKKAKTENQYIFYIDHEEKMDIFFWEIVCQDGLIFDFLKQEIDYEHTDISEFDEKTLRDFDKIIDFMGRFRWLVELLNIVEDESYNSIAKRPAGQQSKPLLYRELFRNPDHANKVKEIFETEKITKDYLYVKNPDRSNNDSELLSAFYVLSPLFVNHHKTPAAKCFYQEFGVNPLSDRMMSSVPYNKDRDRFEKLFLHLLRNN